MCNVNLEELKKPFPVSAIKWRIGQKNKDKTRAMMLCYIDARDVMDRLDEVCGANWSDAYEEVNGRTVCQITIDGMTRADGAGDTDFEGEKGGLSDAFKRAAVKWGIGRYLYNARDYNTWVSCDKIADWEVYSKNKEQLDNVARKLSGEQPTGKTPAQKAAETRSFNKKVAEYSNSDEGLKMRLESQYKCVKSFTHIEQNSHVYKSTMELLDDLHKAGKVDGYNALNELLKSRMVDNSTITG